MHTDKRPKSHVKHEISNTSIPKTEIPSVLIRVHPWFQTLLVVE